MKRVDAPTRLLSIEIHILQVTKTTGVTTVRDMQDTEGDAIYPAATMEAGIAHRTSAHAQTIALLQGQATKHKMQISRAAEPTSETASHHIDRADKLS